MRNIKQKVRAVVADVVIGLLAPGLFSTGGLIIIGGAGVVIVGSAVVMGIAGVVVGFAVVALAIIVGFWGVNLYQKDPTDLMTATTSAKPDAKHSQQCSRAVTGASRLLPAQFRDEYCEEWAAWMSDLRADGTPRLRRWIELLTIALIAAPRLAIALRLVARRAVDR